MRAFGFAVLCLQKRIPKPPKVALHRKWTCQGGFLATRKSQNSSKTLSFETNLLFWSKFITLCLERPKLVANRMKGLTPTLTLSRGVFVESDQLAEDWEMVLLSPW